ncbi:hypothetical protein [Azospirillum thermophilum]|uniref:Capsule biosynthesis protein n=1 Tax=Azospirillum thermophilum TaxID=2202148 RepID=A0A2S2D0J2_9PROT|nr:hypothetical protein [Azospirillum thermophilum]AWK90262.1 hypothetical protein DEW08_30090 [Azospirillum thermophilum]
MKILCYSPYVAWQIHAAWETTILQALQFDGADIDYVLCDGALPACDLDWPGDPRTPSKCNRCQKQQAGFAGGQPVRFQWFGRYQRPEDEAEARAWLESLPGDGLMEATYQGYPIGEWVRSSTHQHFRINRLDLDNDYVRRIFRDFLLAGVMTVKGFGRLLDASRPDLLLVLNGHRSTLRVARELARERGIRTLVHERGLHHRQTVSLVENDHCNSRTLYPALWQAWGEVPLTRAEIEAATGYMENRAHGRLLNWRQFSPAPTGAATIYRTLDLDPLRPVWAMYPASADELVGIADFGDVAGMQVAWIEHTMRFAAAHPEIQLVIRTHPNLDPASIPNKEFSAPIPANRDELAYFTELRQRLPANVRMIMPGDAVSSYDLCDAATVGMVFSSTMGLEMACRGINVVLADGGMWQGLPFMHQAAAPSDCREVYERMLKLKPQTRSAAVQRSALRFAYALVYRWLLHMPLVEMPTPYSGKLAFTAPEDLARGKDPALDRIRRIVFDGESVIPRPDAGHLVRTDAEERAWFGI